jgi:hypothetical protein
LGNLFPQIFPFDFQKRLGVLLLQAANEQTEEAPDQIS